MTLSEPYQDIIDQFNQFKCWHGATKYQIKWLPLCRNCGKRLGLHEQRSKTAICDDNVTVFEAVENKEKHLQQVTALLRLKGVKLE